MNALEDAGGGWVRTCRLAGLGEDSPVHADIGECPVCLVRTGGAVYALRDECTHESVPLSDGDVAGAPLTALAAGQWVAASGLHAERAQAGGTKWRWSCCATHPRRPAACPSRHWIRRCGPVGRTCGPRTGTVYAQLGARAGTVVMVWHASSAKPHTR